MFRVKLTNVDGDFLMSYVEDKRGVPRGSCGCGQCAQYVPQPEGHTCGYCGCLPVKHEDLRKTSHLLESFPIIGTKTEIAAEDELPVIHGPSRPRKSKYLQDRSDAKDWTSEQETARLSGTKTHSGLVSVKTNKMPCGVSLADDSQVHGSFNTPQYQNSDMLKKVPPCELLQTSHMPYHELPSKQPMRGVFKIAYKHKTIYTGKSLNIRRHLKRLIPGRLRQEIGKFLRNLPKKKKKYLTVSWIDSDVHEHNCNGKSYFRCITRLQGEKPKYSYPKRYIEAGKGAAAVPTPAVSTHGTTGMITTADQDCHVEMGDAVPHKSSCSPPHSCYIGVDPRHVKKKRSESPQQPHSTLTGASQGRSKKFLGSENLLKKKNCEVSERNKMTVFESDVHKVESEGGKLASLKGKCQTNHKKPKTSAARLLSKALQPKSTKHSTNAPAALGTKEHTTKTKSCSVLLNKKMYYIPEADVKKPPSEHLEKTTSDTEECPGVERVKALSSLKKILHVPSAEETNQIFQVTKSSKVTVLKSKTKDVTTSTRYMDTTMPSAPGQGSCGVSGQENQLTDIRLNTSTPIPVIPTEEKNKSESICKEEKSYKEYSSPGIPFTEEDNQEWIPDILADSEDSMKLIIDEQKCTYSPDTSQDNYENLPESPMALLKMEHEYKNEVFRSDSKSHPEEDDASVPASPENKEDNPESTPPISTQWVSMSPVPYQHPTKASATDSLRTQSVPMMSQIPHAFVQKNGTFMSESSDLSHSINSCSVTNSRSEGSTHGTTQSSSTDERVSPRKLPRKHHATNSPIAVDDTKPVKEFLGSTALDCTTKCSEGRNSRCDTRIVVCDQRPESCSHPTQYRKGPYIRRESWPMFDNIEHWRSHQHLFKSYSYSRCYTRREQTSGRVEEHHANVKETALVKIERPVGP